MPHLSFSMQLKNIYDKNSESILTCSNSCATEDGMELYK